MMTSFIRKALVLFVALLLLLSGAFLIGRGDTKSSYSEASTIGKGAAGFDELSNRFMMLADEKGAVYAYEVLRRSDLPPNTDLHLLGHTVGDELYKQQGPSGIINCTPEFRNACSHTIVIGTLNEYGGTKALSIIKDACGKAPGGSGAYTMCYHGLGHGVFAYFGYDLSKTVDFCRKTGTDEYNNREYAECVGGSIMELMGGGGHDKESWLKARTNYLSNEDPLAPCSDSVIPMDAKGMCYMYITPHLFEAAGADLALPQAPEFASAFGYCSRISKTTPYLRGACFAGIGKEFPALAMMRDIRNVAEASDGQLNQMRAWCAIAPHQEAYDACEQSVLASLFWGGENNPKGAVRFCALADAGRQDSCFGALFHEAGQYVSVSSPHGVALCAGVPSSYADECRRALPI